MEHKLRKSGRRAKKLKAGNDPFARLPDQVITSHILSRFTLEEGARYCILSHRWKKLWASTIGSKLIFAPEHLLIDERSKMLAQIKADFPGRRNIKLYRAAMDRIPNIEYANNRIKRLTPCFEHWISNVVQGYSLPELDELSVRFPFDFSNNDSIDTWVECALKKGITRLELDLCKWDVGKFPSAEPFPGSIPYCFPEINKLQGMLTNSVGLNLRDVRLKRVRILANVIEFMVMHFPIERLSIELSRMDGQLNISGELVRLKSLELISTRILVPLGPAPVPHLRISASSLTSLKFSGRERELLLEDVPCLTELSVGGNFCTTFLPLGLQQQVYMSGLKRLELVMSDEVVRNSINYPLHLTSTLNLEELTVEIHGTNDKMILKEDSCFLWPVFLINAAPFLRKFSIKLHTLDILAWGDAVISRRVNYCMFERNLVFSRVTEIRNAALQVRNHPCLKTIELHNFYEHPNELEVVQHLLHVSSSLEQILVSPHPRSPSRGKVIATLLPPASKAKLIFL